LDMKLLDALGISLAAMAAVSVGIFVFATRGEGISIRVDDRHVRTVKGEEYETLVEVQSRGTGWIGSVPTTFSVATGNLLKAEPLPDGKTTRLRFLGRYAGRSRSLRVRISLTDPLRLFRRPDKVEETEMVLDTLPLSLIAPLAPRRLKIFGFGERPTGYPGQGQELYGLGAYSYGVETKDIVWRRVAKSADDTLVARVREASVKDVVRIGVVRFAERDDQQRAAWTDMLCEALGALGRDVLETRSRPMLIYDSANGEDARSRGRTSLLARNVDELAEAVMSCSTTTGSRDVEEVVRESDVVVTGVLELEDEAAATLVSRRPLLLIQEKASPTAALAEGSVMWTGKEDLFPLIRKTLER
jgi:hypothetical protein